MSASASTYLSELRRAMNLLADDARTIFVGQGVKYNCHRMWQTLQDVPAYRRIEFPVAEDFQMGFCTGLALEGYIPVCIFPRMDFMLLAANQLVNHLDKARQFGWTPKVIIRTAVGSTKPLDPGPQHSQDHTAAFCKMLTSTNVTTIREPGSVLQAYGMALENTHPTLLIEYMEHY